MKPRIANIYFIDNSAACLGLYRYAFVPKSTNSQLIDNAIAVVMAVDNIRLVESVTELSEYVLWSINVFIFALTKKRICSNINTGGR